MKTLNLLSVVLAVLILTHVSAQIPTIQWQKTLGGSLGEDARTILQNNDGSFVVAGLGRSNDGDVVGNHGDSDFWIVKLSTTSSIEWQHSYGGTGFDWPASIESTSDGGYIVAGSSTSTDFDVTGNHGQFDFWILKLDGYGELEWQKTLGGTNSDDARSVKQTLDGGYILTGVTRSNDGDVSNYHGFEDYWVVKLDATGNIEWQKAFGGSFTDLGQSIKQTQDGGYIVVGIIFSPDGDITGFHGLGDTWVVKLSATGDTEWQKALGGSSDDYGFDIIQTNDNGYMFVGSSKSIDGDVTENRGNADVWVVKLNDLGVIQWQKTYGGSGYDEALSVSLTADNTYVISGITDSTDGDVTGQAGQFDFWLLNINSVGDLIWQKTLGGSNADFCYSVKVTSDNGFILAGATFSNDGDVSGNQGDSDFWVVKLSATLGVEEYISPNIGIFPTVATDYITIYNNSNLYVESIAIYDLNGRSVITKTFQSSFNNETIDISTLQSGNYIAKINKNHGVTVKRFIKK